MPYSHGDGFASSDRVNLPAVEALLRHGTTPDPLGSGDVTPLMLAAGEADIDCVRSLLAAEADPTRLDRQARTAADHAGQTERLMAELLPGAPGDVDEAYIRRLLDARRCAELLAKPPRRRRR